MNTKPQDPCKSSSLPKISPSQKIRLYISCCNLRDLFYGAKDDTYVEVWVKENERSRWALAGKTNVVRNSLNPEFTTPVLVDYAFERSQEIRFEVYDEDQAEKDVQSQHTAKVAQILGAHHQTYVGNLDKKHRGAKIVVQSESVKEDNQNILMNISCNGLKSKKKYLGLTPSNHPYLVIRECQGYEITEEEYTTAEIVYTSEVVHDTLHPVWQIGELPIKQICHSDIDKPLIIEIWSAQPKGKDRIYGRVTGTAREFMEMEELPLPIIKKQGNPFGKLYLDTFKLIQKPTIVDYLRSGWNITMSVAIDFTSSNGELDDPSSLHFIDPENMAKMSPYEEVITQIGKILEPYDCAHQVPLFGFGAKPRYSGESEASHCFNLNGLENCEVDGVKGILEAYREALNSGITLSGPSNFEPCVRTMMEYMEARSHSLEYNVMMVLTDAPVVEWKETMKAISEASNLPMSIIVVGVGDADFLKLDFLDKEEILGDPQEETPKREIMQFARYNSYERDLSHLNEDLLKKIPSQIIEYMTQNNIDPNPVQHDITHLNS